MNASNTDSSTEYVPILRYDLYKIVRECKVLKISEKFSYLEKKIMEKLNCHDHNMYPAIKKSLSRFNAEFKTKWIASSYKESYFEVKYKTWLSGSEYFPKYVPVKRGRPQKIFSECSERSKRRKTETFRTEHDSHEISFATQMVLRKSGQNEAARVIKDVTCTTPTREKKYIEAMKNTPKVKTQMTPLQALSLFVEGEFTRRQYELIQQSAKTRFPCYSAIQKEKKESYPPKESYCITEISAELRLQPLIDLTARRLILSLFEGLQSLTAEEQMNLTLVSKWGCDGSQQTKFKQKMESIGDSDAQIFQSSFVILQLFTETSPREKKIVWQNPTPSSPRYCPPIRIRFIKESDQVINEEVQFVSSQIDLLRKSRIEIGEIMAEITHKFVLTMVDGKVCNSLTGTKYTQKCYICGATSKNFNTLNEISNYPVNGANLQFGLSTLHARIRFFESVLHLSYKLSVKLWQVKKNSEEEKIVLERKKQIQSAFKEKMGLLVDIPKAGFGNTNDGNTSRRFFSDVEMSAEITGVDVHLLQRYKVILEVLTCALKIDAEKFSKYALDTAKLYVELYKWYPMPPTVHKILIHGASVISSAILPIGQLSEEAAEARNKYFRIYRAGFARKFSREDCNIDVLNRLLLKSDPLLSSLRQNKKKNKTSYSKEALEMILPESNTSKYTLQDQEQDVFSGENSDWSSED